jgi:tripartite-type tricarboxylate transporter receptor subunit TctC
MLASDHLYIAPMTMKAAGYEPQHDFAPVAGINTFDVCLGVNTGVVVATTVADYLGAAAKEPKLASYGVPAPGSIPQFIGFVMGKHAGVAMTAVPYKGEAPMITDLSAGHLPAAVGPCRGMLEQRKAGKVRILATAQRLAMAGEVPTFADSGFKMVTPNWLAVFAPAKLPADKLLVMQNAIREVMQDPHFRERMSASGFVPRYLPGKELGEMAQEATAYWGAQIRESGYRPE